MSETFYETIENLKTEFCKEYGVAPESISLVAEGHNPIGIEKYIVSKTYFGRNQMNKEEKKTIEFLNKEISSLKKDNTQLVLLNEVLNETTAKYSSAVENLLEYLKNKY